MDTKSIDSILAATLEDLRLSRAEKVALSDRISGMADSKADLDQIRARAFDLASTKISGSEAHLVLGWLEEVVKVVAKHQGTGANRLSEARFSPGLDCINLINHLFKSSRLSADVCVFTITDDRISKEVLAAHDRGVSIRILTDDAKAWDPGSDIPRFRDAGIPVVVDRSDAHMHHKFAVFDRKILLTGSYNWTRSAAQENQENLVISDHPPLAEKFSQEFSRLWTLMSKN